jgi:hypothetical protein
MLSGETYQTRKWVLKARKCTLPMREWSPQLRRRALRLHGWPKARQAIRAIVDAFGTYDLDRDALRRFNHPVYFALGALSNPDQFREEAEGPRL